jgi:hypothetical protein
MMKKLMIAVAMILMASTPSPFARAQETFLDEGDTAVTNEDASAGEDPFASHEFSEPQDSVPLKSPMPTAPAGKAPRAAQAQPEPAKLPEGQLETQAAAESKSPSKTEKKTAKKQAKAESKQAKVVAPTKTPVPDGEAHKSSEGTPKKYAGGTFLTTAEKCPMMRGPASEGEPMIVVKPSRKIWVEEVDGTWVKAYNKKGEPGYLNRDCFNKK